MARATVVEKLHRITHKVPGVPSHADRPSGHQGRHPRLQHARIQHPRHHHLSHGHAVREPRVLVSWQRWIARLLGQPLP